MLPGLSSELLLGRYELPASTYPKSPLAKHEEALFNENRAIIVSMAHHRKDDFNRLILPCCQAIVEAIGLRLAYDAGLDAGLDGCITDVYLATAIKRDPIWYSENLGITRGMQSDGERKAFQAALPKLDAWLELADVDRYVRAPIISAEKWNQFVDGLEVFSGEKAVPMVIPARAHL
jgi:acyl-CoA oxidase